MKINYFASFCVTRRRLPIHSANFDSCNQMLLKPKYTDNVKDIVFFIECKMYFPMALSKRSIRNN